MSIADLSEPMVRVYEELTDQLLINAARHFRGGTKNISGSFAYTVLKMAELGTLRKESAEIIARMVKDNEPMIKLAVEQSMLEALKGAEPELAAAAKAGLLEGASTGMREGMEKALTAYSRQAYSQMNLVNTVMLDSTLTAYQAEVKNIAGELEKVKAFTGKLADVQKTLNAETGKVVAGVSSLDTAVRSAVQRMNKAGLTGFVDHGGHKWSAEAYARMDIQTTCSNAARQAVFDRNEQYGNDLVWVRTNATAREKCYPWQGKVISMDDRGRTVKDRNGHSVEAVPVSQTSYGQPDGLWGINCHHVPPNVFIPGASLVQGAEYMPDSEENARRYALTQEQRRLEREVRYAKREAAMNKAAGVSSHVDDLKVKKARARLKQFLDETATIRLSKSSKSGKIDVLESECLCKYKSLDEIIERFSFVNEFGTKMSPIDRDTWSTMSIEHQNAAAYGLEKFMHDFKIQKLPRSIKFGVLSRGTEGEYSVTHNTITIDNKKKRTPDDTFLSVMHEMGHYLDDYIFIGKGIFQEAFSVSKKKLHLNKKSCEIMLYSILKGHIDLSSNTHEIGAYSIEYYYSGRHNQLAGAIVEEIKRRF